MSKDDVLKREPLASMMGKDSFVYKDKIDGKPYIFKYIFDSEELVSVENFFGEYNIGDRLPIEDFNSITNMLVRRYGDPEIREKRWENLNGEILVDEGVELGFPISMQAAEWALWINERTVIRLVLSYKTDEFSSFSPSYTSNRPSIRLTYYQADKAYDYGAYNKMIIKNKL